MKANTESKRSAAVRHQREYKSQTKAFSFQVRADMQLWGNYKHLHRFKGGLVLQIFVDKQHIWETAERKQRKLLLKNTATIQFLYIDRHGHGTTNKNYQVLPM